MNLRRRPKHALLALVVLASLVFAQAAVALALCPMERGGLAQMSADCACQSAVPGVGELGMNGCVAHCTSDLQQSGFVLGMVPAAADAPVLIVSALEPPWSRNRGLDSSPPGTPPRRILLHSFLI
jgi:hypothetical protein